MTTDRTRPPLPTDDQLADILRFVARTCLEVERGLRPPAHLRSLMDPAQRWTDPGQLGRFRGGPVQDDQIGYPQFSRLTDTHIFATVVTRTEGDRWGALSLRVAAKGGRWHLADVHRLLAATHDRTAPTPSVALASSPAGLLAHLTEDRRVADAAHRAASRRLADLPADAPGFGAARDLARYWQRQLGELDRHLAQLTTRQQIGELTERVLRR
jgi:hypothetical protein